MSLDAAMAALLAHASAVGVKEAPAQPTEAANAFPFAICYEREGALVGVVGQYTSAETVRVFLDVHVSRQLLPKAVQQARALRDPLLSRVIGDPSLGGAVENLNNLQWTFGRLDYGGVETIGYRFNFELRVRLYAPGA